jgi:hypothetical protein
MKDILKILFFIIIFLGGLYFYTIYTNTKEGLTSMDGEKRCPNLLIQKGAKFYLYNSNIAEVPGVNPIEFNNLEDYVEFLEWQRGAGIICPVLYLQNTYDAQGNRVYKVRPSVTELQGGLPPVLPVPLPTKYVYPDQNKVYPGNIEFNQASYFTQPIYPGKTNTSTSNPINPNTNVSNTGAITATNPNMLYSDDPMDDNWGGATYTQALVDTGYYAGNEVSLYVP